MKSLETIISETFDEVKTAICADYCRYPKDWDAGVEGMELDESAICEDCPLNRL